MPDCTQLLCVCMLVCVRASAGVCIVVGAKGWEIVNIIQVGRPCTDTYWHVHPNCTVIAYACTAGMLRCCRLLPTQSKPCCVWAVEDGRALWCKGESYTVLCLLDHLNGMHSGR